MDDTHIDELLTRGVADVIVRDDLTEKLREGKPLRLKLGIDPTGEDLHIGHAVVLRKMRAFQDLGHEVILVVGDYTARIGDPSGRDKMREPLTKQDIKRNLKTFERQALQILDPKKTRFRYQTEWYETISLEELLELTQLFTVQQLLERDMFERRMKKNEPIGLHEFLYPVLQGYDSVAIDADVEFGGSDQLFNNLIGRTIQEHFGKNPQNVLVTQLLEGLDGRKMSKSYDNYVAIETEPDDMYGKLMTLKDKLIPKYFDIATDLPLKEVKKITKELEGGANPRDAKARLAYEIVAMFHGKKAADNAEKSFDRIFRKKKKPKVIEEVEVAPGTLTLTDLLVAADLASSKSEARRLVKQGGVHLDDKIQEKADAEVDTTKEPLLQVGKRHFKQIRTNKKRP